MESRRSGASTPIPPIASTHDPFPASQKRTTKGFPMSSHDLKASRQATAKRPASAAAGFATDAGGNASPSGNPQPNLWRPVSGHVESYASIPSPLRGVGFSGRRNRSLETFDGNDSKDAMFGERQPTGIWSPLRGPGSSLGSPLNRPPSAMSSPLSRPSSALDQLGRTDSSGSSSASRQVNDSFRGAITPLTPGGRATFSTYSDDALDAIFDEHILGIDEFPSPLYESTRPSTAARTRPSTAARAFPWPDQDVPRSPIKSFTPISAISAQPQSFTPLSAALKQSSGNGLTLNPSMMLGSPITIRPNQELSPQGMKSPFSNRPQTANGLRSPFLSRPQTAHQNMHGVASPVLSVAGALAVPDEEGGARSLTRSRPGTAIAQSSHAERLIHLKTDAQADVLVDRPIKSDWSQLVQVLGFMRKKALQMRIRIIEFMTPFDKLRRGSITAGEFRRAMELCLVFSELSDVEIHAASFLFHEQKQTGECSKGEFEVHGPPRVQYLNFCTVIQPGEPLGRSGRVVLTDDQKHMMLALNEQTRESKRQMKNEYGSTELPKSPLAVIPLSETGDAQLTGIMSRILRRLRATKGSMRQYFGDFESRKVYSDVGKRPTTATMNHTMGCISRTQFERCMFNLCQLSERFEEAELALLFRKYEKCGEFNYYRFVRDVEQAEAEIDRKQRAEQSTWGPTAAPLGGAEPGELGVPEWGRGNGMSAATLEPVFTWNLVIRDREGCTCPDPVY